MDLDKALKNITSVLKKKKTHTIIKLPQDIQNILNELENNYKNYIDTKDELYLKQYIKILLDNSKLPNRKELFLRKINDKETVLDKIVQDDLYINYDTAGFLASDMDFIRIFLTHKNTKVFSFVRERLYLEQYEETTLIEYLIKNGIAHPTDIGEINNKIIIDLLRKYNKEEYLKYTSEDVLLMEYENGKTVLEFLIEHNYAEGTTIKKIKKPIVYDLIVKYNKENLLNSLTNQVLVHKVKGKTILENILEQGIKPDLDIIYDERIVKILIRSKNMEMLDKTSTYLLVRKVPGTRYTLFECLLLKNIICDDAIDSIRHNLSRGYDFYGIIVKHKRYDLFADFCERELLQKIDGKTTLLEILLSNNIELTNVTNYTYPETVKILARNNWYKELQKCDDSLLKTKLENNKYLYEELIERDLPFETSYILDEEIIKAIFDNKKYINYCKIPLIAQLRKYKDNKSYLEHILEQAQTNKEIDLSKLLIYTEDIELEAKMYILYAKYNKQNYLPRLDVEDLLETQSNKRYIDILLDMDSTLTIEKIIDDDIKQEQEIAMIIKLRGQKQDNIKFESITTKLEREYLTNLRFEYEAIKLDDENEKLLGELYKIMDDKKSEPFLLYALIATYRKLLSENNKYAYEVNQLIEIKKHNPEFILKYVKNGAFFNGGKQIIGMEDANIDTLNHEMGHALHHYLVSKKLPLEYIDIMIRLQNDKRILEKTVEYSIRFQELKSIIQDEVEENYMKKYDETITEEKKKEIQSFLDEEIAGKKEKYLKLGYTEEAIDLILSNTYTLEEYLKNDRRVKKNNMVDLILRTRYSPLLCTADYLDAIHRGKFKSNELSDQNDEPIKSAYGHGIAYYRRSLDWAFGEMIANYSEIIKSKNPEEGLITLRYYIGNELVDYIKEYYDNNILYSQKYLQTSSLRLK